MGDGAPGGRLRVGKNQRALMFVGFGVAVPLFTNEKDGYAKFGNDRGIFGCLGAFRGPPGVTDG